MMLWKKGNERFALLIVAVVAVFGLILMFNNSWNDDDSFTGFAAKKAVAKAKAPPPPLPEVKTCVDSDGGRILNVKGFVSGEYVNGQQYRFDDVCRGAQLTEYTCKSPSAMGVAMTVLIVVKIAEPVLLMCSVVQMNDVRIMPVFLVSSVVT